MAKCYRKSFLANLPPGQLRTKLQRAANRRNSGMTLCSGNDSLSRKSWVMIAGENQNIGPPPGSDPDAEADAGVIPGEHWRWCPRCGHELHNEKCKLRCPRCHYFLSCSDFD